MKYVDEFRDPHKARALLRRIESLIARIDVARARPLQLMEVCGGHTHSIFKYGLKTLLPETVEFVHGPGCPVCVLPMGRVDDCVALAELPKCRIPDDHMASCGTGGGVSDTTLSWPG